MCHGLALPALLQRYPADQSRAVRIGWPSGRGSCGSLKDRDGQRQDAARLPLCLVGACGPQLRSGIRAAAHAGRDAAARRVRREVHDRLPQGISRRAGLRRPSCRRRAAIPSSTTSASMPASRCRNGGARAGSIARIRAAGSSGIAATIWAAGWPTRTSARSSAGAPSAATSRKSGRTASPAIPSAVRASARRCCTGPTTAGRSERCGHRERNGRRRRTGTPALS